MSRILPVKEAKLVRVSTSHDGLFRELAEVLGKPVENALLQVFGRSAGFVLQETAFAPDDRRISVRPFPPLDYDEGRIARIRIEGIDALFEVKGIGRVMKNSEVLEIDAFGPFETGPPGGVFLDFAEKYHERGLKLIASGVKTTDIPLAIIGLPYSIEFKPQGEKEARQRKLGVNARLVITPHRIEHLCHALLENKPEALKMIKTTGCISLDEYLSFFCKEFGNNLHRLLFDAKSTHFALWDGGDVDITGGIADYDSVHGLNQEDLADTIDGAITTVKRLLTTVGKESDKYYSLFFSSILGRDIMCNTLLEYFQETVTEIVMKLINEEVKEEVLLPKFNTPEHEIYYYSGQAIR